jgi:anthranilate/para-aminobenzoate synthase component I
MSWLATLETLANTLEVRATQWICFLRFETGPLACHPDERDYSTSAQLSNICPSSSRNAFVRCCFIARPKLVLSETVPQKFFSHRSAQSAQSSVFLIPFYSPDGADKPQQHPCLLWTYDDFIEIEGFESDDTPRVRCGGALMSDLSSFNEIQALPAQMGTDVLSTAAGSPTPWIKTQSSESIREMISHLQKGMRNGDYYLANATTRLTGPRRDSQFLSLKSFVREWLRSPVRQGVFVQSDDNLPAVCCFSPERFIWRKGARVQTEPIKGTAPVDSKEPDRGVGVLWNSEKEMSEQRLVTDLLRNDLNRVCRAGTVTVVSPSEVHSAGSLLQMQSVVTGELADAQLPHAQLLSELLPAGSVTGTPKWAVSREICAVEKSLRGYYTGVFAYACSAEELDSAVLIRGFFADDNQWNVGIGAGITTLSDSDAEVREFELKWQSFAQRWERMTRRDEGGPQT